MAKEALSPKEPQTSAILMQANVFDNIELIEKWQRIYYSFTCMLIALSPPPTHQDLTCPFPDVATYLSEACEVFIRLL